MPSLQAAPGGRRKRPFPTRDPVRSERWGAPWRGPETPELSRGGGEKKRRHAPRLRSAWQETTMRRGAPMVQPRREGGTFRRESREGSGVARASRSISGGPETRRPLVSTPGPVEEREGAGGTRPRMIGPASWPPPSLRTPLSVAAETRPGDRRPSHRPPDRCRRGGSHLPRRSSGHADQSPTVAKSAIRRSQSPLSPAQVRLSPLRSPRSPRSRRRCPRRRPTMGRHPLRPRLRSRRRWSRTWASSSRRSG